MEIAVRADDRRNARIALDHAFGPFEHLVRRRHLEADMQEAKSARLEDLRAVGAAIEAVHIPGLLLEEGRVRTEHRVPVLEAAISEHEIGRASCRERVCPYV